MSRKWEDVITDILQAPYQKKIVTTIDPEKSVIITVTDLFYEAITYYQSIGITPKYFCLLDSLNCGELNINSIKSFCKKNNITLFNPSHRPDYIHLDRVLYLIKREFHTRFYGLQHMGEYMYKYQLPNGYLIENKCVNILFRRHAEGIDFIKKHIDAILRIEKHLENKHSKDVFYGVLRSIVSGSFEFIPMSSYPQYFHPIVHPVEGDIVIEGGIDNGNTTLSISTAIGSKGKIYAFEPLKSSYEKLVDNIKLRKDNITIYNEGLYSSEKTLFLSQQGAGSRVSNEASPHNEECKLCSIDNKFSEKIDLIKLDIEGSELEALKGAQKTIKTYKPKLQISVYHQPADQFVEIIDFILSLDCNYKIELGHHTPYFTETMLYAYCK